MIMLGAILTTLVVLLIGAGLPNFKGVITDPEIWKREDTVGWSTRRKILSPNWRSVCSRQELSQVKQSV